MSENRNDDATTSDTDEQEGISDEQLPDDVRPSDDNPLASGPEDGEEDKGLSLDADT